MIEKSSSERSSLQAHEQWNWIPGYENYYMASDQGRVRSVTRVVTDGRTMQGRVLKSRDVSGYGHQIVQLSRGNKTKPVLVHRAVLMAFKGEPEPGQEGRHLNGDPTDNRLANLAWGTHLENEADKIRHGTHNQLTKTHCPHKHPLDEWNLCKWELTRGHRKCLACSRARTRVRSDPDLNFEDTARWYIQREIERRRREAV